MVCDMNVYFKMMCIENGVLFFSGVLLFKQTFSERRYFLERLTVVTYLFSWTCLLADLPITGLTYLGDVQNPR